MAVLSMVLYSTGGAKGMGSGRGRQHITCAQEDGSQEVLGDAVCTAGKHARADSTWASQLFGALHFLYERGIKKKKGDKGAVRKLLINITGISQQSVETVEAGRAYQELYEIVGFDQHLITLRLPGSASLTLSPFSLLLQCCASGHL